MEKGPILKKVIVPTKKPDSSLRIPSAGRNFIMVDSETKKHLQKLFLRSKGTEGILKSHVEVLPSKRYEQESSHSLQILHSHQEELMKILEERVSPPSIDETIEPEELNEETRRFGDDTKSFTEKATERFREKMQKQKEETLPTSSFQVIPIEFTKKQLPDKSSDLPQKQLHIADAIIESKITSTINQYQATYTLLHIIIETLQLIIGSTKPRNIRPEAETIREIITKSESLKSSVQEIITNLQTANSIDPHLPESLSNINHNEVFEEDIQTILSLFKSIQFDGISYFEKYKTLIEYLFNKWKNHSYESQCNVNIGLETMKSIHDMNNHLTILTGFSDCLRMDLEEMTLNSRYENVIFIAQKIINMVGKMAVEIRSILDLRRIWTHAQDKQKSFIQNKVLESVGSIAETVLQEMITESKTMQRYIQSLSNYTEPTITEYVVLTLSSIEDIQEMLHDTIELFCAHTNTQKMEDIDLYELCSSIIESFAFNNKDQYITFDFHFENNISIKGNKKNIKNIIINILNNAQFANKKNMNNDICINLDIATENELKEKKENLKYLTTNQEGQHPGIHIGSNNMRYAVLSISDTGGGIPSEILNQIFNPLFSTKSSHQGTGLGLANVKTLMDAHNGTIIVETSTEKGTTFKLCFPLHEES